ncbi:uncharacterized protein [Physcomitrium patens]|uniref:uncharacterized protein isoform X3 n=1 Tax=Physcomitrium patens TaxID=3218 RepID=UPI000D175E48|nr:uncharacterized protein LOC112296156 isoform X3 [Physcomitrium patens]|eukprot:XP_024404194.1 uncharacterized protein LOC112296156 isoform X3 [Physcomitrella patens]
MFIGQSRTRNQQVVDSLRTRVGGLRMGAGLGSAAEGLWRGSRHGLGFSPLRSELQLHSKQKLRRTRNYSFRPVSCKENTILTKGSRANSFFESYHHFSRWMVFVNEEASSHSVVAKLEQVLELALRAWRRRNAGTSSLNLGSVGLIGTEQWPYNHLKA